MVAEIAIVDLRDVRTQGASLCSKTRQRERKQLPRLCLRLRREILPSGLPGPVTEVAQFHPASLWWEDLGQTVAQCLPGPMDLNAIDHAVVNGVAEIEVTGLRFPTNRQGSITGLGIERVESGPGPRLRREDPVHPETP